jgi:hypothetical protein
MLRILAGLAMVAGMASGGLSVPAFADEPALTGVAEHVHQPVIVQSRPVIERLPVKVVEPVDLKLSPDGAVFVADRKAECVFRIDRTGAVSLAAEKLPGLQRIQLHSDGSLFLLCSTDSQSGLHQVTASGRQIYLQAFPFAADAFAVNSLGTTYVSHSTSGRIMSVSSEGAVSELVRMTMPVTDLVLNAAEQLEALLPSGQVVRVSDEGQVVSTGTAPGGSTRLTSLQDGKMLAILPAADGPSTIVEISRGAQPPVDFVVVAKIPAGTRAAGFDALGNLCLANPDLRAVTKVTSQFEIPCPHCGRPTRLIFRSEQPVRNDSESARF